MSVAELTANGHVQGLPLCTPSCTRARRVAREHTHAHLTLHTSHDRHDSPIHGAALCASSSSCACGAAGKRGVLSPGWCINYAHDPAGRPSSPRAHGACVVARRCPLTRSLCVRVRACVRAFEYSSLARCVRACVCARAPLANVHLVARVSTYTLGRPANDVTRVALRT